MVTSRLKELEATTLAAVRIENRPMEYIEAQAHEDGYRMALVAMASLQTAARKAAEHLLHVSHRGRLTEIERRDGHDFATELLNTLTTL